MSKEITPAEIERAAACPSTHCNRRGECGSPSECCSTGKRTAAATEARMLELARLITSGPWTWITAHDLAAEVIETFGEKK